MVMTERKGYLHFLWGGDKITCSWQNTEIKEWKSKQIWNLAGNEYDL